MNVIAHKSAIIHPDSKLGPNVSIGQNVTIGNGARIKNAILHDEVEVKDHAYICNAIIGKGSMIK